MNRSCFFLFLLVGLIAAIEEYEGYDEMDNLERDLDRYDDYDPRDYDEQDFMDEEDRLSAPKDPANVNHCAQGTHNCNSQAHCHNTLTGFTCHCKAGFTGNGYACIDINECRVSNSGCHATNGICTNTFGSFFCSCKSGYTGNGKTCTDLNECSVGMHNCNSDATCTNTLGGFTCTCNSGFTGNGVFCSPIHPTLKPTPHDECAGKPATKPDGTRLKYTNPKNCHSWIECVGGKKVYRCTPATLVFVEKKQYCVKPKHGCTV